jgi:uncharacterized protein YqjF (DUF2071 family)
MKRPFLSAEWRHLAMLNYEIDPAMVQPLVPSGTELDFFGGKTFVSLVGFCFLRVRLLGMPIPFHQNFEEVNLRLYVRRQAEEGWRRGVVFIKEIVPKTAVALVARWVYNENYVACRMRSQVQLPDAARSVRGFLEYGWDRHNSMRAEFHGEPSEAAPGSEEEFITEHYWGYSRQKDGVAMEYRVEHPRWRIWRTSAVQLVCDVEKCYGSQFCEALGKPPSSAFVADGSAVAVFPGRRLD